MKAPENFLGLGIIAALLSGCLQAPTHAVLERVSPPTAAAVPAEKGTLMVFSAFETGLPSPNEIDSDINHYSDYEVRKECGTLVAKVKNRSGALGAGPATIELPPGSYELIAETNGYSRVAIPISIARGQMTAIHLEGGGMPPRQSEFSETFLVRIPNGRVVGWCATAPMNRGL